MILLPIHIVAGLLALASGAIAMAAHKGDRLHRKSGMTFAVAMLVMTSSAVLMALFWMPNRVNVVAGTLTFYLVVTSLLTVRRTVEQARGLTVGLMLLAFFASAYAFVLGSSGSQAAGAMAGEVEAGPLFMFGTVGLLAGLLDARMLWAGYIQGVHRIARHLWRMCFAMFVATGSFFLGQAKHFPEAIRASGLLSIPVLLVVGFSLYWFVRVLLKMRRARSARSQTKPSIPHSLPRAAD